MASGISSIRLRLDRVGVLLSALCAVHCVAGVIIVAVLGLGGGLLLSPEIHRFGLVLATIIAGLAIGLGTMHHRRRGPLFVATAGLGCMTFALFVGHGVEEAVLTVAGVFLVAIGHMLNLRKA